MQTKKINELTMMETVSDAANVLVEENGEAQRVPAGKMVAGSLPEHLQFGGEIEVPGDTLTWDGNTDGLLCVMDALYKVSDAVPPIERIAANSVTVRYPDGQERKFEFTDSNIQIYDTNAGFPAGFTQINLTASDDQDLGVFTIVDEDFVGVDTMGASFPEVGVYVFPNEYFTPVSLTIPGYTGFPTKAIKPIDKKYLPADIGGGNDVMIINATRIGEYTEDGQEIELSKTGKEICSAWDDGKLMFLRGLDGLLQITGVDGETCFLCYGLVIGHQMRVVGYEVYFDGNTWRAAKITPSLYDMEFVSPWIYSSNNKTYQLDVDENGSVIAIPKGGFVPA